MVRLVLTDQDLSGKTIKGQPFSYIGNCRGTDIKFVGDWTHVSHFHNDFLRPDWSGAKTRWSYSRFNIFTDAKTSQDMEANDHDMLLAAIEESLPKLTSVGQTAMAKAGDLLRADIAAGKYLISWANVAPVFMQEFKGDYQKALETAVAAAAGRPQLLTSVSRMAGHDPSGVMWNEGEAPHLNTEGIRNSPWGIVAQDFSGKRKYRKPWSELPVPTNPHDRLEMAELIDAEVEKAIGQPVTVYIYNILPWRAYAGWGRQPRDWPRQRSD